MIRNLLQSFALAFQNIRSNLFHTLLSVLGIVIGVAALVATFSLIDGLEAFARKQISKETSINAIMLTTETEKMINNLSVRKDTFQVLDYDRYQQFKAQVPQLKKSNLWSSFDREVKFEGRDSSLGARIRCVGEVPWGDTIIISGRNFGTNAFSERQKEAVVNQQFAALVAGSDDLQQSIGKTFQAFGNDIRIVGVAKSAKADNPPTIFMPISLLSQADLHRSPPSMLLEVDKTEEVPPLKTQLESWIKQEYSDKASDFSIRSQDFWIDQTSKGFLIFRIVMGLIIGLSVMVGGVGVMNVLLISVNERTAEIGLRKAVGAKKSDIRRLFLAESITVSAFGSLVGLLAGAGFAMAAIPIIRFFAEVPFSAAFTWNTFFIICVVAVFIGILFGTYPAIKAARLDPVEALRRE